MGYLKTIKHLSLPGFFRLGLAVTAIVFIAVYASSGGSPVPLVAQGSHGTSIVGIRMADDGASSCPFTTWGSPQYTAANGGFSGWATDNNGFDPDCIRVYLSSFTSWDRDFRVGIQMGDSDASGCVGHVGILRYTPWASEGGGESGWAYDDNAFDPNCSRVVVETRPFSGGVLVIQDARLGMQLSDDACSSQLGTIEYTPWASEGGGWSSWAGDANRFDFDCAQMTLDTKVVPVGEIEVLIRKTGDLTAPLPPATWSIRDSSGGVVAAQTVPATKESAVYFPVPYGTYTITSVPNSLTAPGFTYTLSSITPSNTQTLSSPTVVSSGCPAGQYDPHVTCDTQNGACVAVEGCGTNSCASCRTPFQQLPSLRDPGASLAGGVKKLLDPLFAKNVYAVTIDGEAGFHYVCRGGYCGKSLGAGTDECTSHADCGSSSLPPEPSAPPPPERITFTLTYNAERDGGLTPPLPPYPVGYTLTVSKAGTGRGTVTSAPGGIDCGEDCIQTYPQGTLVDLTATPSVGFSFSSWGGDADCTDGFLTMNANKNCVATFVLDTGPGTPQPAPDQRPIGWHDGATGGSSCTVNGWATDPDNRDKDIRVRIYADGVWLRDELADKYRTDLQSAGVCNGGTCAFVTGSLLNDLLARGLAPGANHSILVNAISIDPSGKELEAEYNLSGTPKTMNCSSGGVGGSGGTIAVDANRPAMWTLRSTLATYEQSEPATESVYSNAPQGTYTITPQAIAGCSYAVSPGSSQYLPSRGSIRFSINYACSSPSTPTLRVDPDSQTIGQGGRACFRAWYDSDGESGSSPAQNVSLTNTSWSVNPGSIAVYEGQSVSCSQGVVFRGVTPGVGAVIATHDPAGAPGAISDMATLNVTAIQPPSLTVNLSANPYAGSASLVTRLTASVGGTEAGTINYHLWWNCGYAGRNALEAQAQCGSLPVSPVGRCAENSIGFRCNAVSQTSQSVNHTYASSGTYRPTVIAERGASSARDAETIAVSGPQNHLECRSNACISVSGSGPNRCNENADCSPGGGEVHSVCDAANKACVNEQGPGANQCSGDPACGSGVSSETHLECQNNACLVVGGPGADECTAVGLGCGGGEEPPVEEEPSCTFKSTPPVIKRGESSTVLWECKGKLLSCEVRDDNGVLVRRGGISGDVRVNPTKTTLYTLTCNGASPSNRVVRTTTVYVSQLEEVPPQRADENQE